MRKPTIFCWCYEKRWTWNKFPQAIKPWTVGLMQCCPFCLLPPIEWRYDSLLGNTFDIDYIHRSDHISYKKTFFLTRGYPWIVHGYPRTIRRYTRVILVSIFLIFILFFSIGKRAKKAPKHRAADCSVWHSRGTYNRLYPATVRKPNGKMAPRSDG